jgi:hypothetical protein
MSDKYPFIPQHLEKALEDLSIPLIDIMHGELKNRMNDMQYEEFEDKQWAEGYKDCLTDLYVLTYNLSIDRKQVERDHHAKLGIQRTDH